MNKKLVAQFMASVDLYTLPTNSFDLADLDSFEIDEIIEQSVEFEHDGQKMFVIPSFVRKGTWTVNCYVLNDKGKLIKSHYTPSLEELSDILEKSNWNGNWISKRDVEEAMKYLK